MTPGCAATEVPRWVAPVAVELAPVRCPEIDPRIRAEFKRTTKPPAEGDLGKKQTRALIDALRISEARKNAAGARVVGEHDACVGAQAASVS